MSSEKHQSARGDVLQPRPVVAGTGTVSNFVRQKVEHDLATGKYAARRWAGQPGPAATQASGAPDPAKIRTRFPPEPNGYLHFGHAKSICLNFGLARDYGGACHLRFDDTNPTKEEQEYVDAIKESVHWLGFDWGENQFHASDYFGHLYEFAVALVKAGHAYVDSLSADEMRAYRGTLTEPGKPSPHRTRSVDESLDLLERMRQGEFPDGAHVLRAKIDMASPNMNLRDPAMYRIRHAEHHQTGNAWSIYPTYDWAHGVSDALENITHSLCTLEFEDHRPLYDWFNKRLAERGLLNTPLPEQTEFARLNLTYVVLSKRKLIQLVDEKHVDGWDDPRLPTLVGARRRGYTAAGFRLFADRIGVSKAHQLIEFTILEDCMREDLNERAERRIAVLDPVKLVIENWEAGRREPCVLPNHPQKAELGTRTLHLEREVWIDREDFMEVPPKGYFRLSPGAEVRLRHGYIVKCTGFEKDADGRVTLVRCTFDPDTRSGTPGAESRKVKGNIHWLGASEAVPAEVRIYDRLFKVADPGAGGGDFLADLNPASKTIIRSLVEPSLAQCAAEASFQFERHGYFVADRRDHRPGAPVFNRAVTLRDSWGKAGGKG